MNRSTKTFFCERKSLIKVVTMLCCYNKLTIERDKLNNRATWQTSSVGSFFLWWNMSVSDMKKWNSFRHKIFLEWAMLYFGKKKRNLKFSYHRCFMKKNHEIWDVNSGMVFHSFMLKNNSFFWFQAKKGFWDLNGFSLHKIFSPRSYEIREFERQKQSP